MANYSGMGLDLPYSACGDLGSYQYYCVQSASTAFLVERASGSEPLVIGILQNDPYSLSPATVRMAGVSKVYVSSSAAISNGNLLICGSAGELELAHSTASGFVGIALDDMAAGTGYLPMLIRLNITEMPTGLK